MRATRTIILVFCLSLTVLNLTAQPFFDMLNIYGQWSGPTIDNAKDSTTFESKFFSADLSVPLRFKKDILLINPSYSNLSAKPEFSKTIDMQSLLLSLIYVKQWKNEKAKTSFVLISRANNDPALKIQNNSAQLGGAILQTYIRSEKLKYKFGAYYNSEFFGPFILPLAGIDWNVSDRLNIFGVLPGSMNLEYILSKRIHAGIAFRSITNSYRFANDTFIRINDNHLKLVMDYYFLKKHVLLFEAGHSVLRKYKPGLRTDGKTNYKDLRVNDGYLIKIGYAFRFRIENK